MVELRFISVDIECNQPSGKIIQIGAAAFDTNIPEEVERVDIHIDPGEPINWDHQIRADGLTLGDLLPYDQIYVNMASMTPKEGFELFWDFVSESRCGKKFIQWGSGDMERIRNESDDLCVDYPKGLRVVDLKGLYQLFFQPAMKLPKGFGLGTAMENCGLIFRGIPHDASADAYNTGRLAQHLYRQIERCGAIERMFHGS